MNENLRRAKGFTLAEVLITLGIIGVVAALVLPSIIVNYEKKVTAVQLKKAYSVMANALKLAEAEHGEFENWYTTHQTPEVLFERFRPYLQLAKDPYAYNSNRWMMFRLKDGTCMTFRDNIPEANYQDNLYLFNVYTKCRSKLIPGRTMFQFSVMNLKRDAGKYFGWGMAPGAITSSGARCENLYTPKTNPMNNYGWKEYECFLKFVNAGWEFNDAYKFHEFQAQSSNEKNFGVGAQQQGW